MDDRERAEILAEILRERMPSVRHIIDEWSVPESDAVKYCADQRPDLADRGSAGPLDAGVQCGRSAPAWKTPATSICWEREPSSPVPVRSRARYSSRFLSRWRGHGPPLSRRGSDL